MGVVGADLVKQVLSFLDGPSIARCEVASKRFLDEAKDKVVWRKALNADFALNRLSRWVVGLVGRL